MPHTAMCVHSIQNNIELNSYPQGTYSLTEKEKKRKTPITKSPNKIDIQMKAQKTLRV